MNKCLEQRGRAVQMLLNSAFAENSEKSWKTVWNKCKIAQNSLRSDVALSCSMARSSASAMKIAMGSINVRLSVRLKFQQL